jgi:integrase
MGSIVARRPNSVPTYRFHKPSGQAVVTIRGAGGKRTDVYLGAHNSPESRAEYTRILQELAAQPATPLMVSKQAISTLRDHAGDPRGNRQPTATGITVNELLLAFWKHALQHYRRPDGTATSEIEAYKQAVKAIRTNYGGTLVREFTPLSLKAIRQGLIEKRLSRRTINGRIARIRHIFKWGLSEGVVPAEVFTALAAVSGLQKGRSQAREPEPIRPVPHDRVRAVLQFVRPPVRGMIEVQHYTGMRPQDVVQIRPCDIDMGEAVWVYRPPHHKNSYRGKARAVAIGPKAQAILKEFMPTDPAAYFFSPRAAVESLLAERAANRKTPRWASHMSRNERKRKAVKRRPAGRCYTVHGYAVAISRGCELAFPPPAHLAQREDETPKKWRKRLSPEQRAELKVWQDANHWHPNQLRHSHGTEVRKRFGLEAAQVVLGHARADVTEIYAEKNLALAVRVANEVG